MNPRLIALAGPRRGVTCELSAREFSIGRDPHSQLCLDDRLVSRHHASIARKNDRCEISDLKSANGTMVNGVPIKQRRLAHCDQIAIGASLLLFLLDEEEAARQATAQLDDGLTTGHSTLLQADDALYLHVEKALAAMPHSERIARDLGTLLNLSLEINSIRQTKEMLPRLLELIFAAIPAGQGAILLASDRSQDRDETMLLPSASLDREMGRVQRIPVSRTVVERVLREQAVLLSDDVLESDSLGPTPSLLASQTRSLLAAPLVVFEQSLGVVYLTSHDPDVRFNKDHQELLTAIARIAAVAIDNIRRAERLEEELQQQRAEMREMIGESRPMRGLNRLIAKAAPSDSTILIRGESGTGKELVARKLHLAGPRKDKPFVPINCAAIPEPLLESELFGHVKGAFSGAYRDKRGLLEEANGGTVFLDEIGDMPLALQVKLLRALQEREIRKVGGTREIKIDVRVIAATNRDLEARIKDGRFREDLYYRINVVSITIPPLRERREDILLLAHYFLKQCGEEAKRPIHGFSRAAKQCLIRYDWPGNVRELQHAIQRAVIGGESDFIHTYDLFEEVREMDEPSGDSGLNLSQAIKETKRQFILRAVEEKNGNLAAAAKSLGVDAANLQRLIRDLKLRPEVDKIIRGLKVKPTPKE
jgi:transcriptional regulator with GAF, ATPase, and Fis domain